MTFKTAMERMPGVMHHGYTSLGEHEKRFNKSLIIKIAPMVSSEQFAFRDIIYTPEMTFKLGCLMYIIFVTHCNSL